MNYLFNIINYYYSRDSFEGIETWIKEIRTKANPDAKTIFIGNKNDLEEDRKVTQEEGQKIAKDYEANLFLETSAKTGFNAQELFVKASELLVKDYDQYQMVSNVVINNIYRKIMDNNK